MSKINKLTVKKCEEFLLVGLLINVQDVSIVQNESFCSGIL